MNKPQSPLDLARWAKLSVEARMNAGGKSNANREVDPRISQERRLQLIQAFNDIDKDKSGKLSYDEIFEYLKDINDLVDETYVQTIFQSMDANNDGQVSIEEFISTYLNQVNVLSDAAALLRQKIQEGKRDLGISEVQLEEALKSERINSWGIMEGSLLNLRVVEAQNLETFSGKPSCYVNILCEKQQIATKIIPNERNPLWNEEFSFRVAAGNGEMLIQVFNKSDFSKDELIGKCSVPLEEFNDQTLHEKWFHLEGKTNTSRVLLSVQWIHRKTKYLKDLITKLQREIEADTVEQTKILGEMMKLGTNPQGMFKKESWIDRVESKVISEIELFPDKQIENFGTLDYVQKGLFLIFSVIALITSLTRPDLVNLTWAGAVWLREIAGWTILTYRYAVGFLFILIFYDFVWIFANFEYLVFSVHQNQMENLHRFCFITGLFGFVIKSFLIIVMVKNFIKFKEQDILRLFNST